MPWYSVTRNASRCGRARRWPVGPLQGEYSPLEIHLCIVYLPHYVCLGSANEKRRGREFLALGHGVVVVLASCSRADAANRQPSLGVPRFLFARVVDTSFFVCFCPSCYRS